MEKENKIIKLIISAIIVAAAVALLTGLINGSDLVYQLPLAP